MRATRPTALWTRRSASRLGAAVCAFLAVLSGLTSTVSLAAPSRAELEQAEQRLLEIERDFEIVVERYNAVHERLDGIRYEIGLTELDVRRIERRMGAKQDSAIALARELYMSGGTSALESVLGSESIADIEDRLTYLNASEQAQAEVFQSLAVDRIDLEAKLRELDRQRADAVSVEQRLTALRSDIEAKVADQKDEIADLNAAIERAEARARARAAEAARRAAAAAPAPVAVPQVDFAKGVSAGARTAVEAALSQVGKPYQWGAAGPDSYDCSGLTMWAWAHAGVSLPHNSGMQYGATPRVAQGDWQAGDLLFFGSPIHHVGMYIGNGRMVEAPYTGSQVRAVSAYRSDYVGAGRPGL